MRKMAMKELVNETLGQRPDWPPVDVQLAIRVGNPAPSWQNERFSLRSALASIPDLVRIALSLRISKIQPGVKTALNLLHACDGEIRSVFTRQMENDPVWRRCLQHFS